MPHLFMRTLLEEIKMSLNWLFCDMINSSYTQFKKRKRINENPSKEQPTIFKIQIEKNGTGTANGTSLNTAVSDQHVTVTILQLKMMLH